MGALDDEGPVNVWYTWKVSPTIVKITAVVVSVCLFLFLEAAPEWISPKPNPNMHLASNEKLNSGAVNYDEIGGAEVVWHSPPNPKAILFLAHGCNHQATDFWHPCKTCPKCVGLPEEVRIARYEQLMEISLEPTCAIIRGLHHIQNLLHYSRYTLRVWSAYS